MRKTLNINLGGLAFIIDENAFELLHNYLEALKRKFNNQAERDEIMNDIEGRIAEMLNQKLADRREVISVEDVQAVMNAMGKPEDIAGEEPETTAGTSSTTGSTASSSSTTMGPVPHKKLFRDADDAKIGGVISGLCHYFGINDPSWARIAVLILAFVSWGSVVLLYILLVIVVPKATTAAEKLQMKGEPININTIEKEVKDAASKATDTVHRLVKDDNIFEKLWNIGLSLLKVFLKLLAIVVIFTAVCTLIAVVIAFVLFYILGTSAFNSVSMLLVDTPHTLTFFSFGFLLFCAMPLLGLIYASLRAVLGSTSRSPWVKWFLLGGWWLGVILLAVSGWETGKNFKVEGTKKTQMALMQPVRGEIFVQLTDSTGRKLTNEDEEDNSSFSINEEGVTINGINVKDMNQIPVDKPELQIMPSENDSFYMQQIITSQGRNKGDAMNNAALAQYSFNQVDTTLDLSKYLFINKTGKYRAQELKLRIAIPEGKKIRFADNIDMFKAVTVKGDGTYDDTYFNNTTWTVEKGVVKCIAGENHKNAEEKTTKQNRAKKSAKDEDDDDDNKSDKEKDF